MIRDDMSIEAQVAATFWTGNPMSESMKMTFNRPWVISPKMRKGLTELVEAGHLTVERLNDYPNCPVTYRPTERMQSDGPRLNQQESKQHSFPVTEERPEPSEDVVTALLAR